MQERRFWSLAESRLFDELLLGARIRGENGETPTVKQMEIAVEHGWYATMMQSWQQGHNLHLRLALRRKIEDIF